MCTHVHKAIFLQLMWVDDRVNFWGLNFYSRMIANIGRIKYFWLIHSILGGNMRILGVLFALIGLYNYELGGSLLIKKIIVVSCLHSYVDLLKH